MLVLVEVVLVDVLVRWCKGGQECLRNFDDDDDEDEDDDDVAADIFEPAAEDVDCAVDAEDVVAAAASVTT